MAWTYSDYVTLSGSARLSRLQLHIQEVSDKITANLGMAGRSRAVDPLNSYLTSLQKQEMLLGGNTPRAEGRSSFVGSDFASPIRGALGDREDCCLCN